jgi:hypothetical protein
MYGIFIYGFHFIKGYNKGKVYKRKVNRSEFPLFFIVNHKAAVIYTLNFCDGFYRSALF